MKAVWIGSCVLGVSLALLVGGCSGTVNGTGVDTSNGNGSGSANGDNVSGSGSGSASTNGNANGSGAVDGNGNSNANANGNGNGNGLAPTGAQENSLQSIESAVLTINTCSPKAGASACTACLLGSCCAETQNCGDSNFCVSLAGCMSKCDDKGCVQTCSDRYGDGAPPYEDIVSCALSNCQAACP